MRRFLYQAAVTGTVLGLALPMAVVSIAVAKAAPRSVKRRWAAFWGPIDAKASEVDR